MSLAILKTLIGEKQIEEITQSAQALAQRLLTMELNIQHIVKMQEEILSRLPPVVPVQKPQLTLITKEEVSNAGQ